jgi:hypothetical protein
VRELPPPFVTLTVCDAGFPPPCEAVKVTLDADRMIEADEDDTVKVTEIVRGLLAADGDATLTLAEYVPAANDPVVACSVIVAGAVVVLSEAVNHPEPEP